MKVFLSWSGARSRLVAQELSTWLKKVVQSVDPWISTDLERGVKWLDEINKSLDEHSIGIVTITPENVGAPWLYYEAGALATNLSDVKRVIPYLLGFRSAGDLKQPLGQFNVSLADREGTWNVVKTLNNHAEFPQNDPVLEETFELWWPKLESKLSSIQAETAQEPPPREASDKLDELLSLVRGIASRQDQPTYGQDSNVIHLSKTQPRRRGFPEDEFLSRNVLGVIEQVVGEAANDRDRIQVSWTADGLVIAVRGIDVDRMMAIEQNVSSSIGVKPRIIKLLSAREL